MYLFSYRDVPFHSHDLALWADRQWLNDICINLAFRVLEDDYRIGANNFSVSLVDPAVVSFLRLQVEDDEEFEELARGTSAKMYNWLLLPINDSISFDHSSTHWSLLICHVPSFTLFHCDSNGNHNLSSAKHIVPKLARLLDVSASPHSIKIKSLNSPRQANSYDCGVYTILFAQKMTDLILREFPSKASGTNAFVDEAEQSLSQISPHDCTQFRIDSVNLIQSKFNLI